VTAKMAFADVGAYADGFGRTPPATPPERFMPWSWTQPMRAEYECQGGHGRQDHGSARPVSAKLQATVLQCAVCKGLGFLPADERKETGRPASKSIPDFKRIHSVPAPDQWIALPVKSQFTRGFLPVFCFKCTSTKHLHTSSGVIIQCGLA
jgi:hypothetical protein